MGNILASIDFFEKEIILLLFLYFSFFIKKTQPRGRIRGIDIENIYKRKAKRKGKHIWLSKIVDREYQELNS